MVVELGLGGMLLASASGEFRARFIKSRANLNWLVSKSTRVGGKRLFQAKYHSHISSRAAPGVPSHFQRTLCHFGNSSSANKSQITEGVMKSNRYHSKTISKGFKSCDAGFMTREFLIILVNFGRIFRLTS